MYVNACWEESIYTFIYLSDTEVGHFLGEAVMAVRQQLSSMLYVKDICEAQIKSLKTGDIDTSVLQQVHTTYQTVHLLWNII